MRGGSASGSFLKRCRFEELGGSERGRDPDSRLPAEFMGIGRFLNSLSKSVFELVEIEAPG